MPAIVEATDSRVFGKERVGLDSLCPVVFDMRLKMTNRQRLDQTLLSVAGEDIRLVGNWERLPGLFGNAEQLAERLNVSKSQLLRCQDIADEILNLGVANGAYLLFLGVGVIPFHIVVSFRWMIFCEGILFISTRNLFDSENDRP